MDLYRMTKRPVSVTRAENDAPPKITGYAAVFYDGTPQTEYKLFDDVTERIMPGAFSEGAPNIVLGRESAGTLQTRIDDTGFFYAATPPKSRQDIVELIERGDVDGSSFHFKVTDDEKRHDGKGGVIWEIRSVEVREVGPVTFPAYEATTAQMRSAAGIDPARAEIDAWKAEQERKRQNDIAYGQYVMTQLGGQLYGGFVKKK